MNAGNIALLVGGGIVATYLLKGKALTNVAGRAQISMNGVKLAGIGWKGIKLRAEFEVSNPTEDAMTFDLLTFDFSLPIPQDDGSVKNAFIAKLRYDKNSTPKIQPIAARTTNNIVGVIINAPLLSLSKGVIDFVAQALKKKLTGQAAFAAFIPDSIYIEGEARLNGVSLPMKGNYSLTT